MIGRSPLSSTYRPLLRALALALAVTVTAPLDPLAAQTAPTIQPGDLIRLVSEHFGGGEVVQGVFTGVRGDSLTVLVGGMSVDLRVRDLQRLEIHAPRTVGQGALRGLKVGTVSGGGLGLLLGLLATGSCDGTYMVDIFCGAGLPEIAAVTALGAGVFGAFGALGGAVSPGRRWEEVSPLDQLSVAPARGSGLSIGYALTW